MSYTIRINGAEHTVDVEGDTPLLWVLRDTLGMVGTKFGCGIAQCGACTVHADGAPVRSCSLPVEGATALSITTIEALHEDAVGRCVQQAWLALDVPQCGYCQGGQILAATALLKRYPRPTDEQITAAMAGNLCRCGTYLRIRAAIRHAAAAMED